MLQATKSKAWRPSSAKAPTRFGLGAFSALLFNSLLVLLPLAGAAAYLFVTRDNLFSYEANAANTRDLQTRVERLAGGLIMLDFDRRRQWDDLVARELVANDVAAARGFLLSARHMLPPRDAAQITAALSSGGGDAALEMAALDLLTPGTRSRYEATVPLLSRRSASGVQTLRSETDLGALGDSGNFEILSASMLDDASADQMHFTLLGLRLGLGGEGFTPRMAEGAAVVNAAMGEMPAQLREDFSELVSASLPLETFRAEAAQRASGGDAASFPIAAAAYRAAIDQARVPALNTALDQVGAMSEATSPEGAAWMLLQARTLRDLPRLRMVAQAAGDRAVAAAKRLERDGRLARVAQGNLVFSRDLISALLVVALTFAALAALAGAAVYQAIRAAMENLRPRVEEHEEESDLVRSFDAPWRVL